MKGCALLILPGSQNQFSETELNSLKNYLEDGGKILVLLSESNNDDKCNINIFLEQYGIIPEMDSLIRTHYYKYFHPKECYLGDCIINSTLNKDKISFNLVYPYGCTMNVSKPSAVAFTSGSSTFPVDRPLGAIYANHQTSKLFLNNFVFVCAIISFRWEACSYRFGIYVY